jgi:hypothetical protein
MRKIARLMQHFANGLQMHSNDVHVSARRQNKKGYKAKIDVDFLNSGVQCIGCKMRELSYIFAQKCALLTYGMP